MQTDWAWSLPYLAVSLWASGWISFSHLCRTDIALPVRRDLKGGRYSPSIRKSTVLMETFYTQSEDCIKSFLLFHCIVFKYIESLSCGSIWKTLKSSALLFYLPPTVPAPPPSPGSTLPSLYSSSGHLCIQILVHLFLRGTLTGTPTRGTANSWCGSFIA